MSSHEPAAASVQVEYNFRHVVYGKTEIVVRNLSHYTQYTISVEACREIVPEEPSNTTLNCSRKSFKTGRTLSLGKALSCHCHGAHLHVETRHSLWSTQHPPVSVCVLKSAGADYFGGSSKFPGIFWLCFVLFVYIIGLNQLLFCLNFPLITTVL
jgi:hypothetical protein